MSYNGIDYGLGQTNIDKNTGIRYGVINANRLDYWFWEEVEMVYPECECLEDMCMCEPIGYSYNKEGLVFTCSSDTNDIFVVKSPVISRGTFCSPCAPGAVSLGTDGNIKAYCLPKEWFEDNQPPYKIESAIDRTNKMGIL